MDRLEQLMKIFENVEEEKKILILPLIENVVKTEKRLKQLEKYPFILYNIKTGETKSTSASKQYKELKQSYSNDIRVLLSVLKNAGGEEEDEFDKWVKEKMGNDS